ncbi:MAG: hypothetical protein FWD13_06400 [Treponema sp.]|nr:hypothetical protein [Treponema sp.]
MKIHKQKGVIFFFIFFVGLSVLSYGQESGKSIRITGIDSRYVAVYGYYLIENINDGYEWDQVVSSIGFSLLYFETPSISNRIFTGEIYDLDSVSFSWPRTADRWNNSGDYYVVLILGRRNEFGGHRYISRRSFSFNNNITEIAFSNFNYVRSESVQ